MLGRNPYCHSAIDIDDPTLITQRLLPKQASLFSKQTGLLIFTEQALKQSF